MASATQEEEGEMEGHVAMVAGDVGAAEAAVGKLEYTQPLTLSKIYICKCLTSSLCFMKRIYQSLLLFYLHIHHK